MTLQYNAVQPKTLQPPAVLPQAYTNKTQRNAM